MMTKIVNHLHAMRFAAKLLPARYARETFECAGDFSRRRIVKSRRRSGHCGIVNVEFASKRNFENVLAKLESRSAGRIRHIPNPLCAVFRETHFDDLRE